MHWQLWQVHSLSKQQPQPASHWPQGQLVAALAAAAGQAASLGQAAWSHAAPLAAEQQLPVLASAASLQQLFSDEQQPVSVAQQADAAALLQAPSSDSERVAAEY